MTPEQMKELAGWLAVPFYADWSFWISNHRLVTCFPVCVCRSARHSVR